MKRLIYSIWDDLVEEHRSADEFKVSQFEKHIDTLKAKHKEYADLCEADYQVLNSGTGLYQDIQFFKLQKLCDFAEEYDEILYLDMDVIPNTKQIIFDSFDLNDIGMHFIEAPWTPRSRSLHLIFDDDSFEFSYMSSFIKTIVKKSMLLLDDITGHDKIANTGVICANSEAIKKLDLEEKMSIADEAYEEALEDNFHPQKILDAWRKNNEVYLSYIIERFDLDYNEIGQHWNYILDNTVTKYTPTPHFIHQVNKEFETTLDALA